MDDPDRPTASGLDRDEVLELLQKVDLFAGLPPGDLDRIAAIVRGRTLREGDVLFEEGDPPDAFYIVARGAVQILKARPDGSEEKLAVRRAGEAFGEMALLDDAPRSATARATTETRLITVDRDDFQHLLGGDSLPLRMMRVLSRALRALGVRFASTEKLADAGAGVRARSRAVSRVMHAGLVPASAPRLDGWDIAGGTTADGEGGGTSVWDWLELDGGRLVLATLDVRQEGLPPSHHLAMARAVFRAAVQAGGRRSGLGRLLHAANEALASARPRGMDQFVHVGLVVLDGASLEWASAGEVPAGIVRADGGFEALGAGGPPLGMMGGFEYRVIRGEVGAGDAVFLLSRGSEGVVRGAADLLAGMGDEPAGAVVGDLHRALEKATGRDGGDTSVAYARRR